MDESLHPSRSHSSLPPKRFSRGKRENLQHSTEFRKKVVPDSRGCIMKEGKRKRREVIEVEEEDEEDEEARKKSVKEMAGGSQRSPFLDQVPISPANVAFLTIMCKEVLILNLL